MTLDRRSVLKTAAWAAPVIALATTAPLAAASITPCETKTWVFDPLTTSLNHGLSDVAKITVVTGDFVLVQYVRDYPNQTSVTVRGHDLVRSPDGGVKAGHEVYIKLSACEDPSFIQVDGNNVHYYGKGVFN